MTFTPKWGLLGCGKIANDFCAALQQRGACVAACATGGSQERADAFATQFGIPRAFDSYDALLACEEVNVVYVSSWHHTHVTHVEKSLRAGKHVLCEKPLFLSSAEVRAMRALASERGLLLVEAFWTRTMPATKAVAELLASGELGRPLFLRASFGFAAPDDPSHRLFDATSGGGAWDIGCYLVQWAHLVFGLHMPEVHAVGELKHGVDAMGSVLLKYPAGTASLHYSLLSSATPQEVTIVCEHGRIELNSGHTPTELRRVTCKDRTSSCCEVTPFPLPEFPASIPPRNFPNSELLVHEVDAMHEALAGGAPFFSLEESILSADILNEIVRQVQASGAANTAA